jgi:hypothetical protein
MVKVREDMTGWVMSEHGVPDSRLTVLEQTEDYIEPNGTHRARWICECSCEEHNKVVAIGKDIKKGNTKSCGCLKIDMLVKRSKKDNQKDLSGEYGVLWTTNTNEEVYFDLKDADQILKHTWYKNIYGYPETHVNGKRMTMHKLLGYYYPDHHNRNKLDNRKENLVSCTVQENNRNMPVKSTNTSGFTGVYWNQKNNKWVPYINPGDGMKYLGSFINKEDAIRVRLQAESKYFGAFAPQRHLFEEYKINVEMEAYE